MYEVLFYLLWVLNTAVYFKLRRLVALKHDGIYRDIFASTNLPSKRRLLSYNRFVWSAKKSYPKLDSDVAVWIDAQRVLAILLYSYVLILIAVFLIRKTA